MKRSKQQQMPEEKLREMFHNYANSATNAGDYPANVPKNQRNSNKCNFSEKRLMFYVSVEEMSFVRRELLK